MMPSVLSHLNKLTSRKNSKSRIRAIPESQSSARTLSQVSVSPSNASSAKRVTISCTELTDLDFLARGSYGCVYTAIYRSQRVAVKISRPDVDKKAGNYTMLTELRVLKNVRHVNIIKLIGYGWKDDDEDSDLFLVLELISNGTLSDALDPYKGQGSGLCLRDSMNIGLQIARAMKHLHLGVSRKYCVLHRDLKPDNIGLSNGQVKLMDFGLSRAIQLKNYKLGDRYLMTGDTGTLRYMAPEVAKSLPYNEKCEAYSFGLIFWQMLTGTVPFSEQTPETFFGEVIERGARPPVPDWISAELRNMLERCWHNSPDERPSFEEIVNILISLSKHREGCSKALLQAQTP